MFFPLSLLLLGFLEQHRQLLRAFEQVSDRVNQAMVGRILAGAEVVFADVVPLIVFGADPLDDGPVQGGVGLRQRVLKLFVEDVFPKTPKPQIPKTKSRANYSVFVGKG